jgi:hypothetical protein
LTAGRIGAALLQELTKMSTLPIRAPYSPNVSFSIFGRLVTAVVMLLDVFVEAQEKARAAHKRFPLADW